MKVLRGEGDANWLQRWRYEEEVERIERDLEMKMMNEERNERFMVMELSNEWERDERTRVKVEDGGRKYFPR